MKRNTILIILGSILMFGGGLARAQVAAKKPNIVFILTDNLGYGELGVYGGGILRGAQTPRIDKLASEGMRLLNFNVEAQCTPSRSALMTGRFSIRSKRPAMETGPIAWRRWTSAPGKSWMRSRKPASKTTP